MQKIRISSKTSNKELSQKKIMINNSINRLYKNVCRNKENIYYNKVRSTRIQDIIPQGI